MIAGSCEPSCAHERRRLGGGKTSAPHAGADSCGRVKHPRSEPPAALALLEPLVLPRSEPPAALALLEPLVSPRSATSVAPGRGREPIRDPSR